jgi:hypothetical protein
MTRAELEAFALEYGSRHFARTRKWPSSNTGAVEGAPGAQWHSLDAALRRCGSNLRKVCGFSIYELNAHALRDFYNKHRRWPLRSSDDPVEVRLANALGTIRKNRPDLCDKYEIPRKGDLSEANRRAHGKVQISCADVLALLCQYPATTQYSDVVGGGGETGASLDNALRLAASPVKRSGSRGIGSPESLPMLCQVNSIARLKAERDADCWRLFLSPDGPPDPRPWAEILAAGDFAEVMRAERVAFLDWANPTGPTVRDWKEPGRKGPSAPAARRPWPRAQWPDLRAMPGPQESREAA